MCIIIDVNVFGAVFDKDNAQHADFSPVKIWVTKKKGFLVFGGAKYIDELERATRYHKILVELKKMGRVKQIKRDVVDADNALVDEMLAGTDCDDSHLIALVRVSGCRLICSNDISADRYLKKRKLYPKEKGLKPPSIYRSKKHKKLLCQKNIVILKNVV